MAPRLDDEQRRIAHIRASCRVPTQLWHQAKEHVKNADSPSWLTEKDKELLRYLRDAINAGRFDVAAEQYIPKLEGRAKDGRVL